MSTFHAFYTAYEATMYKTMVMIFAFALSQVIGWYLGPVVIRDWDKQRSAYLFLCIVLDCLILVFPFLSR